MASFKSPAQHSRRGVAAIALLAVSLTAVSACSKSKSVDDYIHDAQAQRTAGKLPAAIIDLKNALQKDPKNVAARQ